MALDQHDFLLEVGTTGSLIGKSRGEVGVARADNALFDEIEHVLNCAFNAGALGAQRFQVRLTLAYGSGAIVQQIGKERAEAFGTKQALGHGVDHDRLERVVTHADPWAGGLAAPQAS